jgi:site-specific recombinase XerD
LLSGVEAVSIALQHHTTGVYGAAMSEPRLPDLARSFERHLRAENKSDRTVETYLEAVRLLKAFLAPRGVGLAEADRAQIEAFLADLLARWKPATAANRYRSLKVFYAWLEDEGEIAADPMAKMKPPAIPEQPIPVLPDEALRRLFAICAGKDFEARRDTAMIMLLLDSGARRGRAGRPPGGPSATRHTPRLPGTPRIFLPWRRVR